MQEKFPQKGKKGKGRGFKSAITAMQSQPTVHITSGESCPDYNIHTSLGHANSDWYLNQLPPNEPECRSDSMWNRTPAEKFKGQ